MAKNLLGNCKYHGALHDVVKYPNRILENYKRDERQKTCVNEYIIYDRSGTYNIIILDDSLSSNTSIKSIWHSRHQTGQVISKTMKYIIHTSTSVAQNLLGNCKYHGALHDVVKYLNRILENDKRDERQKTCVNEYIIHDRSGTFNIIILDDSLSSNTSTKSIWHSRHQTGQFISKIMKYIIHTKGFFDHYPLTCDE